jgi:hypothetical protein
MSLAKDFVYQIKRFFFPKDETLTDNTKFVEGTAGWENGDMLITVAVEKFKNGDTDGSSHYHGTLLELDKENQKINVALYGMGLIEAPENGKYFFTSEDGRRFAHEWMALPLDMILGNDSLAERKGLPKVSDSLTLKNL